MHVCVLLIVVGAAAQGGLSPQAKQAKIRALEAEIAKTESRLATLKRQLAGLKPQAAPRPVVKTRDPLRLTMLSVGDRGELPTGGIPCYVKVASILDDSSMVVTFTDRVFPDVILPQLGQPVERFGLRGGKRHLFTANVAVPFPRPTPHLLRTFRAFRNPLAFPIYPSGDHLAEQSHVRVSTSEQGV